MTPQRRVRLTFGVLVGVAIVAVGLLGRALAWPASPATGLAVAASGLATVVAGGLALRILLVVGDAPRDIAPANDAGAVAVGVATGKYSVDQPRAADHVLAASESPLPGAPKHRNQPGPSLLAAGTTTPYDQARRHAHTGGTQ